MRKPHHNLGKHYQFRPKGAIEHATTFFSAQEKALIKQIEKVTNKITGDFGTAYADEVV